MKKENKPISDQSAKAHWKAINMISPLDLQDGRLPFWDYMIDYQEALGKPLRTVPDSLLNLLNQDDTIAQVPREFLMTKQLFGDCQCPMPTGIEDLPAIWAPGIRTFIKIMLDESHDTDRVCEFFNWSLALRQGAFLEITFNERLPFNNWPEHAEMLVFFHRCLEPSGLTTIGRLSEFI